ncbi:MAG: peptidylprolyl isomerase, partial [Acidobacteriota bacterium]
MELMYRIAISICLCIAGLSLRTFGQETAPTPVSEQKKANSRPAPTPEPRAVEPFDNADVKTMAASCVELNTEAGLIDIELYPEMAPETVRNFLNLVALGAYDTTTFSRIVPGFVIQGGNLATRETMTEGLLKRGHRTIQDEPNKILHE